MGVEKTIKIIAEKNQLYVLPDSTKVWMEGNSLFEVRKHQGNTFQVYINDAFIEVKGTCFLVKQEDAHRSEITLFEGKIEFNVPSTRQKTVMRHLQKLIYNSVDSQTQIDNIANISWETGDIISRMSRWLILIFSYREYVRMNPHSAAAFIIMSLWTRY